MLEAVKDGFLQLSFDDGGGGGPTTHTLPAGLATLKRELRNIG